MLYSFDNVTKSFVIFLKRSPFKTSLLLFQNQQPTEGGTKNFESKIHKTLIMKVRSLP